MGVLLVEVHVATSAWIFRRAMATRTAARSGGLEARVEVWGGSGARVEGAGLEARVEGGGLENELL